MVLGSAVVGLVPCLHFACPKGGEREGRNVKYLQSATGCD